MSFKDRYHGLLPGIRVKGNIDNYDFWGIVFGRPVAFLMLLAIGDVRWLTPNMLTHVSNLLLVGGVAAILMGPGPWAIAAVILLNLSAAFDCADGQLARYRKSGSLFGSYYDKVSDHFGTALIFSALAWVAFEKTQQPVYFLLAIAAISGNLIVGYVKWITAAHNRLDDKPDHDPNQSNFKTILLILRRALEFRDTDVYLWVTIGLIFNLPELTLILMGVSQTIVAIISTIYRGMQMARPGKP